MAVFSYKVEFFERGIFDGFPVPVGSDCSRLRIATNNPTHPVQVGNQLTTGKSSRTKVGKSNK